MKEKLIELLSNFSHEAITVILAMMPISELRGAIPYAITVGDIPWPKAYLLAVIANFVPAIAIIYFIGPVSEFLRRYRAFDRFFTWLFAHTRKKGRMIERFEILGLILFVAVPLPVTGAWTGSLASFLFGVKKPVAMVSVFVGICIAGAVVTLASLGVISFWGISHR